MRDGTRGTVGFGISATDVRRFLMPASPDWYGIGVALAGASGGGLAGTLLTLWRQRRKSGAETLAAEAATSEGLFAQVMQLRTEWAAEKSKRDECERNCAELKESVRVANEKIERITAMLPSLRIEELLRKMSSPLLAVISDASDGWVISDPSDGGRWLYVNEYMERALKRTNADACEIGWRGLIDPEDLDRTIAVETNQWGETVSCVNRYVCPDASRVQFRWKGMLYSSGIALSRARTVPLLPP